MASKHMTNGRQALKRLEAHIKSCSASRRKAPALAEEEGFVDAEIPAEIQDMPLAEVGKEIAALRQRWQLRDGSPRRVSANAVKDQKAGIERLKLMEKCFKARISAELD